MLTRVFLSPVGWPEDMGLAPDGEVSHAENSEKSEALSVKATREPLWSRMEVIKTVPFWLLVTSYATANLAFQGINISVAPYTQDLGYGAALVAAIRSVRSLIMFAVLPVWGLLSERSQMPLFRAGPFLIQAIS